MNHQSSVTVRLFSVVLTLTLIAATGRGEQRWTVWNASFTLDRPVTVSKIVELHPADRAEPWSQGLLSGEFLVADDQRLTVTLTESGVAEPTTQVIRLVDGLTLSTGRSSVRVTELLVRAASEDVASGTEQRPAAPYLELRGVRVQVDASEERIVMPAMAVVVPEGLAAALDDPALEGVSIGRGVIYGAAVWAGGTAPSAAVGSATSVSPAAFSDVQNSGVVAPDVTFCELFGLSQFGRLFDEVGLAINTTSWNIGNADLTWLAAPDPRHPFIVQNLYRIQDDRFEQIGQSWVKHGFFALGDTQCGTPCTYENKPGHGEGPFLGMGCTDTYTAGLNAFQNGLGPREEINPWTGAWDFSTSEMSSSHGHSPIAHRLAVHDADLDPQQNLLAQYVVEGYYVHFEDVAPLNNAAWKTITSISGSPGGTWTFSMPGLGTNMRIGFAVDAWEGAKQTILAEEIPVVKGVSSDGRCDLRAKATDNGDGSWHYEYAILNIDMNRKGRSFTVPLHSSNVITNIGFRAVESHNESFDNLPWSGEIRSDCPVGDRCVHWETTNNPLRWGTVYNFRFDANAPPQPGPGGEAQGVTVVFGLFEPGDVMSVSGASVGPGAAPAGSVSPMEAPLPDAVGSQLAKPRFISFAVPEADAGVETALRVELTSLHHPLLPANAPDFSAFERQLRFVNLYRDLETGELITDCPDSAAFGTTFKCAVLGCEPEYADWAGLFGGEVLHVSGAAIVPSSTYNVATLGLLCQGQEASCGSASQPLPIATAVWGNVDGDALLDIGDVTGVIDSVKDIPNSLIEPRSLLRNNVPDPLGLTQSVLDITLSVDALKGLAYPFAGPSSCP